MRETGNAHDRGECITEMCTHPEHFMTDATVDLDELIRSQLDGDREFEGMVL